MNADQYTFDSIKNGDYDRLVGKYYEDVRDAHDDGIMLNPQEVREIIAEYLIALHAITDWKYKDVFSLVIKSLIPFHQRCMFGRLSKLMRITKKKIKSAILQHYTINSIHYLESICQKSWFGDQERVSVILLGNYIKVESVDELCNKHPIGHRELNIIMAVCAARMRYDLWEKMYLNYVESNADNFQWRGAYLLVGAGVLPYPDFPIGET